MIDSSAMGEGTQVADSHAFSVDVGGIRVHFADGCLAQLGACAAALGARRTLIVTDPGIERAGHVDRAVDSLVRAGIRPTIFDGVVENPTSREVDSGVAAARAAEADLLVGLGGGSAMDCAKGINFVLTNGGRIEDYWGHDKAHAPMLPSIGVPTTAGTGSEAQRFALISRPGDHVKMACGDRKARFRTVLLDPTLLASQPRSVAAVTAMDAVSHALESYVTRHRNPIAQLYAREAWTRLARSLEPFIAAPSGAGPARDMLLGAHLAGAAIEASMLGAAHACANPLTARFGLTHGTAVALMLPHVVRFNSDVVEALYAELALAAGLEAGVPGHAARIAERTAALRAAAGLPARLRDLGIDEAALGPMAEEAAVQWTAAHNPRDLSTVEARHLYQEAW